MGSTTQWTSLCIVNLRGLEGEGEYQGHPCENKRLAEYSAAEMFLESTADLMVDKEKDRHTKQDGKKSRGRRRKRQGQRKEKHRDLHARQPSSVRGLRLCLCVAYRMCTFGLKSTHRVKK